MITARFARRYGLRFVALACVIPLAAHAGDAPLAAHADDAVNSEWPTYGNDPGGTRYAPLQQVTRHNVSTPIIPPPIASAPAEPAGTNVVSVVR